MALVWVTGSDILEAVGAGKAPKPEDEAWADACAAAVNAGIETRLGDTPMIAPEGNPELIWAARTAGAEAYKRREAVFGLTGYVDLQGAAIRVARDYLEAIAPVLWRYSDVAIA